ncbi:MAG: glutathione S-transferase family protein, partial [Pseudomonadota bacterium]
MIELYKFVPQFGMRDASPFCLKLLTYLKLADIPHETHEILDPREAPKQKLPFIIDDGISISD